jgi:hypothetical protein
MKCTFLLLVLVSLIALIVSAQNTSVIPPGHQMLALPDAFADGHLAALDKQVSLSPDQKPQLRAVFLQEGKELFAIFGDTTLSDAQKAEAHPADPRRHRAQGLGPAHARAAQDDDRAARATASAGNLAHSC